MESLELELLPKTYESTENARLWMPTRIWESPIYQFRIPEGNGLQPYFFDVTGSASPNLKDASSDLAVCLRWAISETGKEHPLILDFGAGRLRNTLHLLRLGHSVTAVEFSRLSNSEAVQPLVQEARTYAPRFSELIFPHEFLRSSARFDLILLINMINIMPVPVERYLVLQYCREKLTKDGLILWYSQTSQTKRYKAKPYFGDGQIADPHTVMKTFYKDYKSDQIDELLAANGLRLKGEQHPPHNWCKLYKEVGGNPTKNTITAELARRYVEGDLEYEKPKKVQPDIITDRRVRKNFPDPPELSRSRLYVQALRGLPSGRQNGADETYQNLVGAIFLHLFPNQLENMEFEHEMHQGRDRVDLFFRNHALGGFFIRFTIPNSPYVYVECKNYTGELGANEINQSIQRVATTHSHLGIVVCRHARKTWMNAKCGDACDDEKTVMWLEDSDLAKLLSHAGNDAELGRVLMGRIDEINAMRES